MRPIIVAVLLVSLSPALARAQEREQLRTVASPFEASLALRSGPSLRVVVRDFIIDNKKTIERLPVSGTLVVQLRAGLKVTTIIDGKREEHRSGQTWIVPAGSAMGVETTRWAVILHVVALETSGVRAR